MSVSTCPPELTICKDCRLHEKATQVVPGEGSLGAKILFLGEAPGYNEDRLGRPFVGRAGNVLDSILRDLGIKRKDAYITNIVKHWPEGNRDPLPDEIAICKRWLDLELEIVKPKLIVCLGLFAASRFFPNKAKIGSFRVLPDKTIVVSVYHPAFFLRARRPAIRQQILAGIREGLELAKR